MPDKRTTQRAFYIHASNNAVLLTNWLLFRANTALAGMVKKYRNAFTIVTPAIVDSSVVTLSDDAYRKSVRHMTEWGMTARGELADPYQRTSPM